MEVKARMRGMTTAAMLGSLLCASAVLAQEPPQDPSAVPAGGQIQAVEMRSSAVSAPSSTWGGEAEAGAIMTSGNTETESIKTKLRIENERVRWRHRLTADYLKASDSSTTTAERTTAAFKSDYKVNAANYFFAVMRYDRDTFSGYTAQTSETAGYGRRLTFSSRLKAEIEGGVGGRQTRYVDRTRKSVAILRLAAKCTYAFSQTSEVREEFLSEIASDNTYTESVASLKSRINGKFSMKLAFTWTHNSYVPQDIKKTDTTTSVTLVYDI